MGFRVSELASLLIECCLFQFSSCALSLLHMLSICLCSAPLPLLCFAAAAQVWYDNRADDLTKEGMLKGIEQAAAFVLFLSSRVLERSYCQMEIRHALALKKPIILVHGA